ncbi:ISAs1 family transposase [Alkalinema pantanalense CENA528]|uniref:ISAs1 family transposase n=1 Tax=Alkalinema pantanalense TaxID=1620705 RepID=UPI003D6F43E1
MSLIESLQKIRDYRTQPDYPLWVILVLVIMGTMSGCTGYRALADFVSRHQAVLLETMELPYTRLPSLSTLRRIMVRVDFNAFTEAFNEWAQTCCQATTQQVPMDGKSIKASLHDYDQSYQDFVSVVSAFSVEQGVVVALTSLQNADCSEIKTVEVLLNKLHLTGICFSLDAPA